MSQIEVVILVRDDGTKETCLRDKSDFLSEIQDMYASKYALDSMYDGVVVACAEDLINDNAIEVICKGKDLAECVREDAEELKSHCDRLDRLIDWFQTVEFRLTSEQIEEWSQAMNKGVFERDLIDGQWELAKLTRLREEWEIVYAE